MKKITILSVIVLGAALMGCSKNDSSADNAAAPSPAPAASNPAGGATGTAPKAPGKAMTAKSADSLGAASNDSGLGSKG